MAVVDFAIYDRTGQLAAVADVQSKTGTTHEWATQFRRNILAFDGLPGTDFFLLLTPDRYYLWKPGGENGEATEPTFEGDASPLFAPYFAAARLEPNTIQDGAFELIVASWFSDLVRPWTPTAEVPAQQRWLVDSGFLSAVKNGRVEFEVAA